MDPSELSPVVPFERSFDAKLGLAYELIEPHKVVGAFHVRPDLLDANGRVHGSVFVAVAEGAASIGTAAGVLPTGMMALGLSDDTSVVGDVQDGRITAVALRRTAQSDFWIWDVEARDEHGRTCALSTVRIAVRPMRSDG